MKKTFITVIAVLILLVGVGFAVFFSRAPNSTDDIVQSDTVGFPIAQNATAPVTSEENFQQPLNLPTNDFLTSPDTYQDPVNAGYYSLGNPINQTATSTTPYLIMYIESTRFFTIELVQEPIGEARTQTELYLEQRLGLSPSDLCKLNYTLSVPVSVSQEYAGKNLGFSFCPGATVLPK